MPMIDLRTTVSDRVMFIVCTDFLSENENYNITYP